MSKTEAVVDIAKMAGPYILIVVGLAAMKLGIDQTIAGGVVLAGIALVNPGAGVKKPTT